MAKQHAQALDPTHPALSATRPVFVDNRRGNSLDAAICDHLRTLRRENQMLWGVDVATAFFNVQGFALLADELERVGRVRLLLGADPRPEAVRPERTPGSPPEPEFTKTLVHEDLERLDDGLRRSRDLLPFDDEADAALRRLLAYLHSGKIEVRRFERQYLHAKAFVFRVGGGGLLVGSSNLTYAGLRGSLELNLGHYEDPVVGKVEDWFDELWHQATPFDLAAIYDRLMAEYPPYLIYLRVLWELYGEELSQEQEAARPSGVVPVTTFQRHGVWRALRIMERCGGVLVADGVGLGKTFLAGEIIRVYRDRRQKALIVCPAALRDSTWDDFLHKYEFDRSVECVSYEELARDRQLGGEHDHLRNVVDDYALVVVDEAHNYRNPASPYRAGVLRKLLSGQRRDVLMLSATPVNNSLWDLYHLLRYFIKQDALFADRGVLSLRRRFEDAMAADPFNLNPDLLYPVIDATTVKRTRRFIKRHYADDMISLDGRLLPIRFPKPVASSINYDLDAVLPGFFQALEAALAPADGRPRLRMARYQPQNYLLGQSHLLDESALVGLIRTGLLKRFESSTHALERTLRRMIDEHEAFLESLDRGLVPRKDLLRELSAADDDDVFEELLADSSATDDAALYDVATLRNHVRADRDVLEELAGQVRHVRAEVDPKLSALCDELVSICQAARRDAVDDGDFMRDRKVLIFTYYEETVDYIEECLRHLVERDERLAPYKDRIASVAGHRSRSGISRDDAVHGFAPESSGARGPAREDRFDVLICTDVLAEGMNLQQCRNIINYDMPWNPMRLVQRHGRIDRIGSKHPRVFLRTFFPDRQLDGLLKLEHRVRCKLAHAALSVGIETAPIQDGIESDRSFVETRDEIERLKRGDATLYESGGTVSAAQSGEEYRQELRQALATRRDEILALPWKAGSGLAKGAVRGHFFLAKVGERHYTRFVPLDDAVRIESELGACLRLIECDDTTSRVVPHDLRQTAVTAWSRARADVFQSWMRETDPANLQPKVSRFCREVAHFLRGNPTSEIEQSRLERCLDAIESPVSRRDDLYLREVVASAFASPAEKSRAIVEAVERLGLEPFASPRPLPPISQADVHLICWLAIEAETTAQ